MLLLAIKVNRDFQNYCKTTNCGDATVICRSQFMLIYTGLYFCTIHCQSPILSVQLLSDIPHVASVTFNIKFASLKISDVTPV